MGKLREMRRSFRAWKNCRRLEKEGEHYERLFRERGLSIPGDDEIRALVKRRLPDKAPRPKGRLHILAVYHNYNWEGPSFGPSLAAFGEVRTIDWRDPALADGIRQGDKGWMARMNEGLLRKAAEWNSVRRFDAVFTYISGEQITPEAMDGLRALGAPIVNISLNDKEFFTGKVRGGLARGVRDVCSRFDLCWTSTEDALPKYLAEGAIPVYMPEGANPLVHRPYEVEREFDISFVGQCYGNRPEVVSRLRAAGIKIEAFGPGWPRGPLPTEEMVRTWSRSRINLGFGGVLGHKGAFCLKGRDFEVPMSGGLYLTEHHDELAPFYEIGREIATYSGFDDLVEKIRRLLSSPDEADAIRRAGRERALREHTWEMRFERAFRLVGALE